MCAQVTNSLWELMTSDGDIAQLGEHLLDVQRVAGSSPVVSIIFYPFIYWHSRKSQ